MIGDKTVSIILPVYNAGPFLKFALISLLNQTYSNLQIIVVDDGSTDNCIESIFNIQDSRVCILQQQNAGKSVAINKALQVSTGEYYAIQDADDLSAPQRIEQLIRLMENDNNLGGIFSGYDLLFNGLSFAPIIHNKDAVACKKDIDLLKMPSHDPTGFYRKSMVKDIQYDPELKIGQGYDYILRVGEIFPLRVIPSCLYTYRINYQSTTRVSKEKRVAMILKVWEKACERRGIDFSEWCTRYKARIDALRRGSSHYGIVPHCMESVYSLKTNEYSFSAVLRVALTCCAMNVYNLSFYKPLIYAFLPASLISYYRSSLLSK